MLLDVMEPAVLRIPELSDDAFFDFCTSNEEYRIERTSEGRVIIMSGTGGKTGSSNNALSAMLWNWSLSSNGVSFDSSTMFRLPNSAMRSPDAAWVSKDRLAQLSENQKSKFLPLCPDFVIELTSPSDRLTQVREKMEEWISNGVRLGWLIDPDQTRVEIYRAGAPVEILDGPVKLAGEGSVEGFVLDLTYVWNPRF